MTPSDQMRAHRRLFTTVPSGVEVEWKGITMGWEIVEIDTIGIHFFMICRKDTDQIMDKEGNVHKKEEWKRVRAFFENKHEAQGVLEQYNSRILTMEGVTEHYDGLSVTLRKRKDRLIVEAEVEIDSYNYTGIDLLQLLEWIRNNRELIEKTFGITL